jgi:broad specificity phosphatase PhoE
MPIKLYIIRHAETDKNIAKSDSQNLESSFMQEKNAYLNRNGKFQAMILGHYFRDTNIDISAIYASPMLRTFETADTIMKYIDDTNGSIEIIAEQRLLSGTVSHKKHEQYDLDKKIKDKEKLRELVLDLIKDILDSYDDENIILITHNHIIDILYSIFVNKEHDKTKKYKVPNCSISCLEFNKSIEDCKVIYWNKTIKVEYNLT